MTITFSWFIVYLKTITTGGYSLCFSPHLFPREILRLVWSGFLKFISRCVLSFSHYWPNYLHTCHKSKCKHLLSWVSHKPNNKTFQGLHLSIRCVYASVLTTNTHTYQSFILLKSSAWNVFICCVVSSEARIIQSFASWSRLNLN